MKNNINQILVVLATLTVILNLFGCGTQVTEDTEQSRDINEKQDENLDLSLTETYEDTEQNSEINEKQNENVGYLSLTETYEGGSGHLLSNVNCISCYENGVDLKNVHTVEYSSQYPLTIYDKRNEAIYYSDRVDDNGGYGDQLFYYDLKSKESVQLTDNIYAINYIFPVKDSVYMLGAMKNTHYLTIIKYDLSTKELSVFDDEGVWTFDLLVYDVYSDKLFASACNAKEEEENREAYNSRPEEEYDDNIIPTDYTIFVFEDDFYNPQKIMKTEHKYIRRMAATPDGKLFVTTADTFPVMDPEYESFFLNLKTLQTEEAPCIDDVTYVTEFVYFFPNDSRVYFIGDEPQSDEFGLCSYDTNSQKVNLLYEPDVGYINNCFLLK